MTVISTLQPPTRSTKKNSEKSLNCVLLSPTTIPSEILVLLPFGVMERVRTDLCGPEEAGATPDSVTSSLSSSLSRALHSTTAPKESLMGLDSGIPWIGYNQRISVRPSLPVTDNWYLDVTKQKKSCFQKSKTVFGRNWNLIFKKGKTLSIH